MEVDSGAAVTVIGEQTMKSLNNRSKISPCNLVLKTYTGESITPVGSILCVVEYENQRKELPVIVTPGDGPCLMGRNWLRDIKINWTELNI